MNNCIFGKSIFIVPSCIDQYRLFHWHQLRVWRPSENSIFFYQTTANKMPRIQSMGTELVWVVATMVHGWMGSGRMIGYNIQHVSTDWASACNPYTYLTINDKSFVRVDKTSYEFIVCATTGSATDRHSE